MKYKCECTSNIEKEKKIKESVFNQFVYIDCYVDDE